MNFRLTIQTVNIVVAGYIISLFILLCPVMADDIEISVESSVSPKEAIIGETLRYSVTAVVPNNWFCDMPDIESAINASGGLVVRDRETIVKPVKGGIKREWQFFITGYTSGEYTIPEIETVFKRNDGSAEVLVSQEVALTITGVVPADLNKDFTTTLSQSGMAGTSRTDPAGQDDISGKENNRKIDIPVFFRINEIRNRFRVFSLQKARAVATNTFFTLFFFIATIILIKRVRRKKTASLSLYEKFVEFTVQAEALLASKNGDLTELVRGLDTVFRPLIRQHLECIDPGSTTKSLITELESKATSDKSDINKITDILNLADKVKYSAYLPEETEIRETLKKAREVIGLEE